MPHMGRRLPFMIPGIVQTVPAVPVKYTFLFLFLSPHFSHFVPVDIVPEEQERPAQEQQEQEFLV